MGKPRDTERDWEGLKVQFGQCDMTLREFGAANGIPISTVRHRAGKERWLDYREDVRKEAAAIAAQQAPEKRAERLLAQQAELEDKLHETLLAQLDSIRGAKDPVARKTEAISFGIMMDKRDQELERQGVGGPEEGVVEETYSRRQLVLRRYQDPEEQ